MTRTGTPAPRTRPRPGQPRSPRPPPLPAEQAHLRLTAPAICPASDRAKSAIRSHTLRGSRNTASFFITSFAIGVGGTGWLIQGEVFPTSVRGRAAAIAAAVDWVANFALIEAFPAWQNAWGLAAAMVSFAVLSVVAIGFVFKFVPETKGRSVEEVVQIFEQQAEASKAPV